MIEFLVLRFKFLVYKNTPAPLGVLLIIIIHKETFLSRPIGNFFEKMKYER